MLHFVEIEKRVNKDGITVYNVDGYSDRKTLSGAIREIGREIAKIDKGEGELLINNAHTKEDAMNCIVPNCYSADQYCFEIEEVGCASMYNEETDEVQCEEGNYYFHIRFFLYQEIGEEKSEEIVFLEEAAKEFEEEILFAEYAGDTEAVKHFKKKLEETKQKIKNLR